MGDDNPNVVEKKIVAVEVLGHQKEKNEILIANSLGAIALAGMGSLNKTASLIVTGAILLYNGFKYMKINGYTKYIKEKYGI